jgi:hypothetical protein
MAPRPHALLVCRPEQALMIRELEPAAAAFLAAAECEVALGAAVARCGAGEEATLGRIIAMALELRLLAQ